MALRNSTASFPLTDGLILERLTNPKWFTYFERFMQVPGLNADLASTTESVNTPVNRNLEVLGGNMTSALATFRLNGGLTITTAGADGDTAILAAHLDTKQSALAQAGWDSANQIAYMANIETGSSIASSVVWGGFKLTNTSVTITDADQFFFRYEDDVNSGRWQAVYSIAGVDVAFDTGITVAVSTLYRLLVILDKDRIPSFYINDVLVEFTTPATALTELATFEFYTGVEEDGASGAKAISIRNFMVSQLYT